MNFILLFQEKSKYLLSEFILLIRFNAAKHLIFVNIYNNNKDAYLF
jgi:hypothetical protein